MPLHKSRSGRGSSKNFSNMIIFGWGKQTIKQIGITFKNLCNHCHNEEYWILTRITTWFTLFFIPVIPYSIKYFLSCPVCQYGLTLDSTQTEQIKPLAEVNQLLVDGKITEAEYQSRMQQLRGGATEQIEAKAVEPENLEAPKALAGGDEKLTYCAQCGTQITKEIKFCGSCGTKIAVK